LRRSVSSRSSVELCRSSSTVMARRRYITPKVARGGDIQVKEGMVHRVAVGVAMGSTDHPLVKEGCEW
jgi:hypothetical protein